MNYDRDLRQTPNSTTNRRHWLAGAAGALGIGYVGQAFSTPARQVPEPKRVSNPSDTATEFEYEGYRIVAHSPLSKTDRSVPIVFLFGGNGMGAVVRSVQADQLAGDLADQGIASVIVNYPNLTSEVDFVRHIIDPMAWMLESPWSARNRIDTTRIGAAGFSAGGLVATLLATRYRDHGKFRILSSLNYYGPVDLRQWFAFHDARADASGMNEIDPFYRGVRGPEEIGHSVKGTIVCRELSRSVRAKVAENIGGLAPGKLAPFSDERITRLGERPIEPAYGLTTQPRLIGAFGTRDDNCDSMFQPRVLQRLGALYRQETLTFTYEGPHGVSWRASRAAVDALLEPLRSPGSGINEIPLT